MAFFKMFFPFLFLVFYPFASEDDFFVFVHMFHKYSLILHVSDILVQSSFLICTESTEFMLEKGKPLRFRY